jgi:membrane fusion protein (multidrug efflux system)
MAMPVTVATVQVQTVPIYREFVGQTSAQETVDLRARVGGFLQKIAFQEGARVRTGQILFEIEPDSYQAALAAAEAQLARDQASLNKALKDVARLQPLAAGHAASEQDLDAAVAQQEVLQAAVKADQAAMAQAKLDLSYTVIRSPIDGTIGKLAVTRGNLVGKGENTLLATVSSFDPIYVYFSVPEGQATDFLSKHVQGKSKVPQLELQLSDGAAFARKGAIDFADRAIDAATGTLTLRGVFPNPQGLLRPGQFARVRVAGEQVQNAVLIPQKAVSDMLNRKVAITVDSQNVANLQPITLGGEYQDQFIVTSGLKGGERIVVDGLQKARPGAPVAPLPASADGGR